MMVLDLILMLAYSLLALFWMVVVTDGDPSGIAMFMGGVLAAGIGALLAVALARKNGRKQERGEAR